MLNFLLGGYTPLRKRRLHVPEFVPQRRMEILVHIYAELSFMDTSLSLDPDGLDADQIQRYAQERPQFFREHGYRLLGYLKPYTPLLGKKLWLLSDEWRRVQVLRRLLEDQKKTESE